MKKVILPILMLVFAVVAFYLYSISPSGSEQELNKLQLFSADYSESIDTVSILTFNIGYLSGMTNNLPVEREEFLISSNLLYLNQLIQSYSPDLIGFQEIDFGSKRSCFYNQFDSVAKAGQYPVGYRSVNWDKKYVPFPYWPISSHFGKIVSGQTILSKFPIGYEETITLIKPKNAPFFYNDFYLDRLIQVVDVTIGSTVWKVMNVHLEAFDEETRVLQSYVVKEKFEEFSSNYPVLLLGDFNSKPEYETSENLALKVIMQSSFIKSAVTEADYRKDPGQFYTFNSRKPYQMIDYIFYNENFIKKCEVKVLKEAGELSDHLPLFGKFYLVDQNQQ